jgi:hypothetical protein
MGFFAPATRVKSRLRAAIAGPSGSGKTFTALRLATAIGKKICIVASEPGAAEKYVGLAPDGSPWAFDVCTLSDYSPSTYKAAIIAAASEGYDVCIVDSLSHEWEGSGGALELVDQKAAAGRGNKFTEGWSSVTPMHRALFETIVRSPCHIIATVRTKTEYTLEKDERGKAVPVKHGTKPVQREGVEYEFDVFARMDLTHTFTVEKTRCANIDGLTAVKPSANTFAALATWLNEGADPPAGYYTANEEDLRRSQEAREKEAKAQAKAEKREAKASTPQKSAKEVMEEAAAKAKGQAVTQTTPANGAATTPANDPPLTPDPAKGEEAPTPGNAHRIINEAFDAIAYATEWQIEEINTLFKAVKLPPDRQAKALGDRGAKKVFELRKAAAEDLLCKLRAVKAKIDGVAKAETTTAGAAASKN